MIHHERSNQYVKQFAEASMGMGGGYVPMVYENHGIDSRYTGPHEVVPTISARCGTGGNNVPLVGAEPEVYCIVGNVIDRQPQNGGNGCGYQKDVAYTLTAMDHHAIFSRQRTDVFQENDVVSTESARQHKDATDLVLQPYQQTVGTLVCSDHKGISNQYVNDDKCIVGGTNLIRRLTPLECERLQGFPDGWTNIEGASDSARYKALGNSVAIPCVEHVMRGIALALRAEAEDRRRRRRWSMTVYQRAARRPANIPRPVNAMFSGQIDYKQYRLFLPFRAVHISGGKDQPDGWQHPPQFVRTTRRYNHDRAKRIIQAAVRCIQLRSRRVCVQ